MGVGQVAPTYGVIPILRGLTGALAKSIWTVDCDQKQKVRFNSNKVYEGQAASDFLYYICQTGEYHNRPVFPMAQTSVITQLSDTSRGM